MTTSRSLNNSNNKKNDASIMMEDWKHLTESSKNLNLGQYETPRINRSLLGIEAEAQRLSSRPSRHVSNAQLYVFPLSYLLMIQNMHKLPTNKTKEKFCS